MRSTDSRDRKAESTSENPEREQGRATQTMANQKPGQG